MKDLGDLGPGAPVHVYPTWGPAHVTDGRPCWCGPRVEREDGSADIVVHNAPPD